MHVRRVRRQGTACMLSMLIPRFAEILCSVHMHHPLTACHGEGMQLTLAAVIAELHRVASP